MEFNRNQRLAKRIVLLDGLPHSGKMIIGAIVSSMYNTEQYVLADKTLDYLLRIYHVNKISKDAIETVINTLVDYELYDLQLARNVNFNKKDNSSIYVSTNLRKYEERANLEDNENILKNIQKNNPVLPIMLHDAINFTKILHETLSERLLGHIFMQRHPLSVFFNILERRKTARMLNDPRVFEIFIEKNNTPIEAAIRNKKLYADSNEYERIIYLILTTFPYNCNESYMKLTKLSQNCCIFVPFEEFVVNPDSYVNSISDILNTKTTEQTGHVLKKLNIPRDSHGLKSAEITDRFNLIVKKNRISNKILNEFYKLVEYYENSIKSVINM